MVTIFVLKKFICTGNKLLTGRLISHYLMERIMALRQMIDKEKQFLVIFLVKSVFHFSKPGPIEHV